MNDLELLILSGNNLTGSIPSQIGNLNNLNWLLLNDNQFSKEIPSELGRLKNLTRLLLNSNQLSGPIPSSLSELDNIATLRLDENNLSGCIPESLTVLCGRNVLLENNECLSHDADFVEFCENPRCDYMDVCECISANSERATLIEFYNATKGENWKNSSGWLSECDHCEWYGVKCDEKDEVVELILNDNNLGGSISITISRLVNLAFLDLSGNNIAGSIPSEIEMLEKLQFLRLNGNSIGDTIPSSIGNLQSLWDLRLNDNLLIGTIPAELSGISNLFNLHLSNNQLSGSIPNEMGSMSNIFQLYLQKNNLSGCIPMSFENLCGAKIDLTDNPCLSHEGNIDLFCDDVQCDLSLLEGCDLDTAGVISNLENTLSRSRAIYNRGKIEYESMRSEIKVFPNPIHDNLFVCTFENYGLLEARIVDINGKNVMSMNIMSGLDRIDLSQLNSGVYFLELNLGDQLVIKKILKR